jgi:hypothetical protein
MAPGFSTPTKKGVVVNSPSGKHTKQAKGVYKRSITKIVEMLEENPNAAILVLDSLQRGDFDEVVVDVSKFDSRTSKMSQIPKYFLASLLNIWQPKFSKQKMEALDALDADVIRQMIEFATGIDLKTWRLPRAALVKSVLTKAMTARYHAFGARLSDDWVSSAIKDNTVNWATCGVYKYIAVSKDETLTYATHLINVNMDQVPLSEDCAILLTALISDNFSDVKASLRVGWRISGDVKLFKTGKFVLSSHQKVWDLECAQFEDDPKNAPSEPPLTPTGSSGSADVNTTTSFAPGDTSIGQPKRKARKPKFEPSTASLVKMDTA